MAFNLGRFLRDKVDILIMPHAVKPIKINVKMWGLLAVLFVWLGVTFVGLYALTRGYDYHMTRADNQLMKTKLALIAEELDRGRKYIEMTEKTDQQMRLMLGMPGGKNINNPKIFDKNAQPKEKKTINFANIFKKDVAEIDESEFKDYLDEIESSALARLASYQEIAWFYANKRNVSSYTPSIRPSNGRLTSGFGYRLSPVGRRETRFHQGVDFADKADSHIKVTADGVVRQAGWAASFGQAVLVDHGFGYSTLYAHVTGLRVKAGDRIKRGDVIATMGTTGRSTGVHLHYEVWKDGKPVNPRDYFK